MAMWKCVYSRCARLIQVSDTHGFVQLKADRVDATVAFIQQQVVRTLGDAVKVHCTCGCACGADGETLCCRAWLRVGSVHLQNLVRAAWTCAAFLGYRMPQRCRQQRWVLMMGSRLGIAHSQVTVDAARCGYSPGNEPTVECIGVRTCRDMRRIRVIELQDTTRIHVSDDASMRAEPRCPLNSVHERRNRGEKST
jgi:hypothetical protein